MGIAPEVKDGIGSPGGSGHEKGPDSIVSERHPDRRLLSCPPVMGTYVIQNGVFRRVSPNTAFILGYDQPVHLSGNSFWALVHPDDRPTVRLRTGCPSGDEWTDGNVFRVFKKNGTAVRVCMQGGIGRFEGKPANIGILIDISSLINLNASLEKYQTIIDAVQDAVAEADLRGNITFTNEAGCRIFGHSRREAIGRNFREYMDESAARYVFKTYKNVYETGIAGKGIVYEIIRKNDGRRRVGEDSVSLISNENGEPTGFRTVSRDITARRETEARLAENRMRLEAIFKSVQDAIITVDLNLNVTEANHAAASICGLEIDAIQGKPFSECVQKCSRACQDVLIHTLEKKASIKDYRIQCGLARRPDQKASVSSSPLLDKDGRFMGAVLVIRDITLLNKLKRQLSEQHQYQHIIGRSKKMRDLFVLLDKLADMDTTVLVTGESGTGKELIAKALHKGSHRALKPFISVNCSALAENLLESELFGHVKGAFTGAFKDSQGRFQAAGSGTVLLDEVGDISPMIQLKLLRVLQEKEYERVGESVSRKMNARVIACTNTDLKEKVSSGVFREDLYYRLKVMEIALPPLRERMEDVPLLAGHFCNLFNERFGKEIEGLSSNALARLMNYPWPGNIRELEHAIERAFVLCGKKIIMTEHLPPEIRDCWPAAKDPPAWPPDESRTAETILDALSKTFWNKSKAADLLGMSRPTLYKKMRKHQIIK